MQILANRLGRRRSNALESQRQPNEIKSRGESDYPIVNVFGERRIPGREVWRGVSTWETRDAPYFSDEHVGIGRTFHTLRALTKGEMDSLSAFFVDEELWGPVGVGLRPRVWKDRGRTADGKGIKIRSDPERTNKTWRAIIYPLADGTPPETVLEAARDIGDVANALPFDETFRGNEVASIHIEAFQPPFGASPLVVGDPLPIVWDEDSNGPAFEFVIKGRKIRIPTAGMDFEDWPVEFTRNASAVRLWEVLDFEGIGLRRVSLPSFIEAFEISARMLTVDVTDELCNLRFAYRLTADDVRPPLPAGNDFPPPDPWLRSPPKTTTSMRFSWICHQRKVNGAWTDWMKVRPYGRTITRPGGDPRGETQEARITVGLVRSTGGLRPVTLEDGSLGVDRLARTGYSIDGSSVKILAPIRTEDDPDPDPREGDYDEEDEDENEGDDERREIPRNVNPGDPDSEYCGLFDTDKEVGQYEINGVVTSEDGIQAVRDEMDFAWAGSVVNDGGMLYARPGEDRDPVAHIDATVEDVELIYAQSAPSLPERINACTFTLANSRTNGFK
ncbi:MAG: hypothetical protein OXF62_17865, partial [Caldilineaceae bacterium]|nr:hypothetical protein [Caldilineaceae bacterium]